MNLHDEPLLFSASITDLSMESGISPIFIEKDYWLTLTLKRLSKHKYANLFVFKGGTSLSKTHGMIKRFSEDVDLAILVNNDLSGNQVRSRMKMVAKAMTHDLPEIVVPDVTSKGSRFRRTAHRFPTVLAEASSAQISTYLLLEINAFGNPHPFRISVLQSMLGEHLEREGRQDLISRYGLEPFGLQVLRPERTFGEKVLAVVRASYDQNPFQQLRAKVRHLYDLHLMMNAPVLAGFIASDAFFDTLYAVQADDARNHEFQGAWAQEPLSSALVFQDDEKFWQHIEVTYMASFSMLVYGELPALNEIRKSLGILKHRLEVFDRIS